MRLNERNNPAVRVRVVESADELAALGPTWEALQADARIASIFETHDWQRLWWQVYGHGRALRLLVAERHGTIVGILPVYIDRWRVARYSVRALRFVGAGGDTSPDDLGPTLAAAHEAETAAALADAVLRLPGWDILQLTDMNPDCAFTSAMAAAARRAHLYTATGTSERILYLTHASSVEAWYSGLAKDRRQRARAAKRKLETAHPDARSFVWRDAATLDAGIQRLAELHQKRRQQLGGPHGFSTPEYMRFHRDVMHACHLRGRLLLYCLEVRGQIIAIYYVYLFRNRQYLMQTGFDPDFGNLSPGNVLLTHLIEHGIESRYEVLDFLRGDHRYKRELATGERETVYLTALRWRPGAGVFALRRLVLPALKVRAKEALKRWLPADESQE